MKYKSVEILSVVKHNEILLRKHFHLYDLLKNEYLSMLFLFFFKAIEMYLVFIVLNLLPTPRKFLENCAWLNQDLSQELVFLLLTKL